MKKKESKTFLFVLHTQYNLLLAVGLCRTVLKGSTDLILFKDFDFSKVANRINGLFRKKLILEGNYPQKTMTPLQKMKKIAKDNKKIELFITDSYDEVWIVDDACIQEMYTLKCCKRRNPLVEMSWLEDGSIAYFSNGVKCGGMGSTPIRRMIRKRVFSTIYSLGECYDLAGVMGGHKQLKKIYVTFPNAVRKELKYKEIISISDESFRTGIDTLYCSSKVKLEEGSILVALDKLDVYGNKLGHVNDLIAREIEKAKERNATVYYKYHPRETDCLPSVRGCIELDRKIALESYLVNSTTRDMTVFGIKSTPLQTAKKMGYKSVSLIRTVDEDMEQIVKFYKKIGIECR